MLACNVKSAGRKKSGVHPTERGASAFSMHNPRIRSEPEVVHVDGLQKIKVDEAYREPPAWSGCVWDTRSCILPHQFSATKVGCDGVARVRI